MIHVNYFSFKELSWKPCPVTLLIYWLTYLTWSTLAARESRNLCVLIWSHCHLNEVQAIIRKGWLTVFITTAHLSYLPPLVLCCHMTVLFHHFLVLFCPSSPSYEELQYPRRARLHSHCLFLSKTSIYTGRY